MVIVNKSNFSVHTLQKLHGSVAAPKNKYYADFKICFALEGEAVWEIDERPHRIRSGDIVFLKIGQKRHFTSFGKQGFKLGYFTLTRNAFSGLHHFVFFLECIKRKENVIKDSPLFPLLKEIYEDWRSESPYRYELASAKLTEFFIKAERRANDTFLPITQSHYEMPEIMDYIDENITSGINLSAASRKAGMTESSFSRRFSTVNGISFKKYVVEKKIQRAIFLLQTTNRKMIDIALDSGFDSVSGFYDAFKKQTGVTPSKFMEYEV